MDLSLFKLIKKKTKKGVDHGVEALTYRNDNRQMDFFLVLQTKAYQNPVTGS